MKGGKNLLGCKEAATILGYTQRHILNLIKKGKLSAHRDEAGQYFIDKSEFYRVYPEKNPMQGVGSVANYGIESSSAALEERVRHLEEMVREKTRHAEFLTEQIQNFTQEKSKMLEAITSYARLLEHKETVNKEIKPSKARWWSFKSI